jgi:hypothetical protein
MTVLRVAGVIAACLLVSLGAAYYFTYEPAPRIAIRWPTEIKPERRQELERRFLVVNPATDRDRVEYDLLDTSRDNVEALVREPDVLDTDRVSRERFTLPLDVPYGTSWMWVAHRTPVLRIPGVVGAIAAVCAAAILAWLAGELRGFRRTAVRR